MPICYIVFEKKYDHYENGVDYYNVKLTLYNDKLEAIKQREYISHNYFVDMYEKDNKILLIDYSGNEFVLDENGMKSRIYVGKMIFEKAELYTKWTIGHINGKVVNVRPGFCKTEDD